MHTLSDPIRTYLTGRRARGEISRQTALDLGWTLQGFAESFGARPLSQLGPAAVDRWLEQIGHHADATRREYLSRVRGFCRWLVAQGVIRRDPTAHVPAIRQARKAVRVFTPGEKARVYAVLPDARARAIVSLLDGCGARCCEVARLRVEDYTGHGAILTGKGGHERPAYVPAPAREAIAVYLDEVGVTAGPLIRSTLLHHQGLSAKTISGYVRGWLREAGVKQRAFDGRSAHAYRRSCGTELMDLTGNVQLVQQVLGHERTDTTVRSYLQAVTQQTIGAAMEARYVA